MKLLKVLGAAGLVGLFGVLPLVGLAQGGDFLDTDIDTLPDVGITDVGGIFALIIDILNIAFTVLLILAVVFVLVAAYKYLTAGGDPEKIKSAHGTLIWALVGVVVAVLAIALVTIVKNTASNL